MTTRDELLQRVAEAERRLNAHLESPPPGGLTEPDPDTAERWEAGQVWAHLAEFPAYWVGELRRVVGGAGTPSEPVAFGRTRTDPGRIGAIERDRDLEPAQLFERTRAGLADLTGELRRLPDTALSMTGVHPTLGEMTVVQVIERFVIDHLHEHADQLDLLTGRAEGESAAPTPDAPRPGRL